MNRNMLKPLAIVLVLLLVGLTAACSTVTPTAAPTATPVPSEPVTIQFWAWAPGMPQGLCKVGRGACRGGDTRGVV